MYGTRQYPLNISHFCRSASSPFPCPLPYSLLLGVCDDADADAGAGGDAPGPGTGGTYPKLHTTSPSERCSHKPARTSASSHAPIAASSSRAHGTNTRNSGARTRDVASDRSCADVPRGTAAAAPTPTAAPAEDEADDEEGTLGGGRTPDEPESVVARLWPRSRSRSRSRSRGGGEEHERPPSDSVFVREIDGGLESSDSLEKLTDAKRRCGLCSPPSCVLSSRACSEGDGEGEGGASHPSSSAPAANATLCRLCGGSVRRQLPE